MQQSKKRILGAAGLTLVAGTTVVAHNIQTPSVYAESTSVEINAVVVSNYIHVEIEGPLQDGGATSKDSVDIPLNLSDVVTMKYEVIANQTGKQSVKIDERTFDVIDGTAVSGASVSTYDASTQSADDEYSGMKSLNLPLKDYKDTLVNTHGYDPNTDILFTLVVTVYNSGGASQDSISFTYGAITIDPNTNVNPDAPEDETNVPTNDVGDPEITIGTGETTELIHVIVRDPETGEIIWEGDFPAGTDITTITLPFAENGITSGNYVIEVYAYDEDGNMVGKSELDIRYVRPDGIGGLGLPNTGGISIAGLNIARADFLISGALIFFLIGAGGIYLIHRKQTRK